MKQKKFLAIVGSMLLALTACSGGGSELDPTPSLPPLTVRPLQARFHCGYVSHDTQPRQ